MFARNQNYCVYLQSNLSNIDMNKQSLITILLTISMSISSVQVFAHDIEVPNAEGVTIYYVWTNYRTELAVSYRGMSYWGDNNEYVGDIVIPSYVEYGNNVYSVTSIGDRAFCSCSSLTSVTIPQSVTSIGDYAFSYCEALTSITIPNTVTSIGDEAFYGTAWFNTWYNNQADGLVYLGKVAYDYKGNMPANTQITIMDGTLGVADWAFSGCKGLTSITIPNSVVSIGDFAFYNCSGFTSVNIPNSVTTIGESAFANCTALTSICIPNSVNYIGSAFINCSSLSSIEVESDNPKYDSRNDCNAVIETSSNKLISGCKNTIIPNGVTSIDHSAFSGCSGLATLTIPNTITSIGGGAFYGCSGLTSITVESGNPKYDSRNDCNAIIETSSNTLIAGCKNTIIPNSVTSIGDAFRGCSSLTTITIPNSVTSINDYAFDECINLTSVIIGNGVTFIGECGLYCPKLNLVVLETETPPFLDSHGFTREVFASATLIVPVGTKDTYLSTTGWSNFKNIIEKGKTGIIGVEFELDGFHYKIGENNTVSVIAKRNSEGEAVGNEYSGDIVIPDYVDFNGVPYKVTSIDDEVFRDCNGLTSVVIPNSVNSIGKKVFRGCTKMKSVTIGNGVTSIGDAAFEYCWGLSSLTIPKSVTSIGIYAFNASHLMTIISEIENPYSITNNVFKEVSSYAKLIVPKGTKSKYQATDGWNRFTNIVEVKDGDANGDEEVNQKDVENVESFIMGETPSVFVRSAADMNGDEKIDVVDIVLMQNLINKE